MNWKNEEEILALRRENEEMKKKFAKGGPFGGPSHPTGPRTIEEPKAIHTEEAEGESYLNRSILTTGTLNLSRRHHLVTM